MKEREDLADLCHEQWAHWMKYLFSKGEFNLDGTWTMPAWAVERWQRQMNTPYAELSEEEKESDRKEADKFLAVFKRLPISPVRGPFIKDIAGGPSHKETIEWINRMIGQSRIKRPD